MSKKGIQFRDFTSKNIYSVEMLQQEIVNENYMESINSDDCT